MGLAVKTGVLIFEVDGLEDIGGLPLSHEEHLGLLTALVWAELWGAGEVVTPVFYRGETGEIIQGRDVVDWVFECFAGKMFWDCVA